MQAARLKARQRRVALDVDREARDRRVQETAADVFGLIDERAVADQAVSRANIAIGDALRRLIGEDLTAASVAKLVDLDVTEVRKLTVTRPTTPPLAAPPRCAAPPSDAC